MSRRLKKRTFDTDPSHLFDGMAVAPLMQCLGEGVVATDVSGFIGFVNTCAEQMFAMKERDVIGEYFSDVFAVYDKQGEAVAPENFLIPKVLKSGRKAVESTYYYATTHRKKIPAAVTTAPITIEGKILGTISIFRDMRREAGIDKAKTEFVSLASHQLRTPLTAIKLFTEILLSKHVGIDDPEKEILENIERSNEKMIRLVNDLLNVSTLEAGRLRPEITSFSICELLSSTVGEISAIAYARNIHIDYACKIPEGVKAETDANLLRQVINNIVTNAIEYSPPNSKITIRVKRTTDKGYCIGIKDRGIGISKRAQKEIFNRFFRAQNAIKFKTESSGLGLYVCKMMMEAIGGRITFKTIEGKGTTFFVYVPPVIPPAVKIKAYTNE